MTDNQKMWAVFELLGKLISDTNDVISEARRGRCLIAEAIETGDTSRVAARAKMVASDFRVLAQTGEKIGELVQAIIAPEEGKKANETDEQ